MPHNAEQLPLTNHLPFSMHEIISQTIKENKKVKVNGRRGGGGIEEGGS